MVGVAIVSVVGDRHLLLTIFDLPLTTYYLLLSTYYGLGGGGGAGDDRGHSVEAWLGLGPTPTPNPNQVTPSKRGDRNKAKQFMPFLTAQARNVPLYHQGVTTNLSLVLLSTNVPTLQESIRKAQSAEATAPRAEAGTTLDRRACNPM
eukprot:scaffold27185_cov55-Phaeocystis_antarctica.AAC.2